MPDQYVSGNEITGNQGNPALGYSSGVQYNANPADTNPFQGISSTLTTLQSQYENRRLLERQRKLEEQDKLAKYLATSGNSAFNMPGEGGKNMGFEMLPEDAAIINKATDDWRRHTLSKKQTFSWDPEIAKQTADLQRLIAHAGVRSVDIAKKHQLAASTNDPIERDRILKNIESEKKKPVTDFSMPEPYMPDQKYNPYITDDVLKNKNLYEEYGTTSKIDEKDGSEKIETKRGLSSNVLDKRNESQSGGPRYGEAVKIARSFYADPMLYNADHIMSMNDNIDAINKQRGYTPGSPHYIPHIAEVMPNREIRPNKLTPADVEYAVNAEHAGGLITESEIKRTAGQVGKENNGIELAKAESKRQESHLKLEWEKFKNDKNKQTKEDKEDLESKTVAHTIYKTLAESPKGKPLNDVIAKVPEAEKGGLIQTISNSGIDLDNYKVSQLNPADGTVKHIAGVQYINPQGQMQKGTARPTYAYVAMPQSGDLGDARFVIGYPDMVDAVYPEGNEKAGQIIMKDGKPVKQKITNWKILTPQEAVGSYLTSRGNFSNITTGAQSKIDKSTEHLTDMLSHKNTQEGTIPNAPAAGRVMRQIGGKSYEQINGQWYPVQ